MKIPFTQLHIVGHRPNCMRHPTEESVEEDPSLFGTSLHTIGQQSSRTKFPTLHLGFFKLRRLLPPSLRPHTLTGFFTMLDAWEGLFPSELHHRIVARIKNAMYEHAHCHTELDHIFLANLNLPILPILEWPKTLINLDISRNRLRNFLQIPPLPISLQELNVSHNQLTILPDLPHSLQSLRVSGNCLTHFSALPNGLVRLIACNNQLYELPTLPHSLHALNVSHNQLTDLPELPENLRFLNISGNRLTSLPDNLFNRSSQLHIFLGGNLFSDQVIANLRHRIHAPEYQGPRFYFEMFSDETFYVHLLSETVLDWYPKQSHATVLKQWQVFDKEEGAEEFSLFLDRLKKSIHYTHELFREKIAQWLTQLISNGALRKETYSIAVDAFTTCEDRGALTFNDMKKACLVSEVQAGNYDTQIEKLIMLARGLFRLDELEKIARKKVKSLIEQRKIESLATQIEIESLPPVDEIEVYLAYQVKLRTPLNLPIDIDDMRYFRSAEITQQDLDEAIRDVQEQEKENFSRYLYMEWSPWQNLLKRLHPEDYQETNNQLYEMIDSEDFRLEVKEHMDRIGNLDQHISIDAERTITKQLSDKKQYQIKQQLTERFLQKQGIPLSVIDDIKENQINMILHV